MVALFALEIECVEGTRKKELALIYSIWIIYTPEKTRMTKKDDNHDDDDDYQQILI